MARDPLHGEVLPVRFVDPALEARLFMLHEAHYDATDPTRFHHDLREKDWVLLLRDPAGEVVGFSTQTVMRLRSAGEDVRALFSGDTVIHRDHWGTQVLVRTWCRFAGALQAEEPTPLYWFLISKGYRTYLYLPLFFREFSPRWDAPTPPVHERLLGALAERRYPRQVDHEQGLIRHAGLHDRLKPALDTSERRPDNPHVRFFLQRNPRYAEGDELICLAEISPGNLRGIAQREMLAGMQTTLQR